MLEALRVGPSDRVFILTGAGISAESGIRTFRDAGGLWEKYRFEEVASPEGGPPIRRTSGGFTLSDARKPPRVSPTRRIGPSPRWSAHWVIACSCARRTWTICTKAGSTRVHHMHGELFRSRCELCTRSPFEDRAVHEAISRCECGGRIRPHIVWFGEMPFGMDVIADALGRCTMFVTVGSSGAVYPAAGFVGSVAGRARTIYVRTGAPRQRRRLRRRCRLGKAGEVLPTLFET